MPSFIQSCAIKNTDMILFLKSKKQECECMYIHIRTIMHTLYLIYINCLVIVLDKLQFQNWMEWIRMWKYEGIKCDQSPHTISLNVMEFKIVLIWCNLQDYTGRATLCILVNKGSEGSVTTNDKIRLACHDKSTNIISFHRL